MRPGRAGIRALAVAALLAAGSAVTAQRAVGDPTPDHPYLTDLAALFEELDENYPFFALKGLEKDWKVRKKLLARRARDCRSDEGFAEIVVDTMRALRDGHCGVESMRADPPRKIVAWPGVALMPATKGLAVVMETAGNLRSALPPGTIITRIDGKPAAKALAIRAELAWREGGFFSSRQRVLFFEYRQAFSGERGSKTEIHSLDGREQKKLTLVANQELRGWAHNYHLPEELVRSAESVQHCALEEGVAYVYLRRMDETLEKGLAAAIDAHPDAAGWIVDLRGNTGGGYSKSLDAVRDRLGKRVAVIIDAGAISAAETFARDLVRGNDARLFGATTAGSSSTKKSFTLPSGFATVRYSTASRNGVKGTIEFHGIEPDVEVFADPREVAAGKNSEILRCLQWLAGS